MVSLGPSDITHIHDRLIEATGGSFGLREPSLLAAIAEKPYASFDSQDLYPGLADKAAALFEALCNYHVFIDGNKRTAITCLEYFLYLNGHKLIASSTEREQFTIRTATHHPDLTEIAIWIKQYSQPESTSSSQTAA